MKFPINCCKNLPILTGMALPGILFLASCAVDKTETDSQLTGSAKGQTEPAPVVYPIPTKEAEDRQIVEESQIFLQQDLAVSADSASVALPRMSMEKQGMLVHDAVYPGIVTNSEQYQLPEHNGVVSTLDNNVSTFSIDVDTAAYANVRRILRQGQLPPVAAVRVEELINYFSYAYDNQATPEQPFSINTELAPSPWNPHRHLLRIGIQGYKPETNELPGSNLVFLVDVSGSMNSPDKLGLLKSSLKMLVGELTANDRVSIVTYAGTVGTVLDSTPGDDKRAINAALQQLHAGGSTNGEGGIRAAYDLAEQGFIEGGINRVILATDGDFNVGIADTDTLVELIEHKADAGIALTTLGFGTGNYNDHLLEQLADNGDGNHAYIDTVLEANKVLVQELTATLMTIAKDVKIQIEFNPAVVSEYRLIGYENRMLREEDFRNDAVDAGEIGAGHSVTALYEVVLQGSEGQALKPRRYSSHGESPDRVAEHGSNHQGELAEIAVRYKLPAGSSSQEVSRIVYSNESQPAFENASTDFRFASSVAAFGQWLGRNTAMGAFEAEAIATHAAAARGDDPFGYRSEFVQLVHLASNLPTEPDGNLHNPVMRLQ